MEPTQEQTWETLRRTASAPAFDEFDIPLQARNAFYVAMGHYIEKDVHGLWMPPESLDGHNAADLAIKIGERMSEFSEAYNGPGPESPIEGMLLGALLWLEADWAELPKLWHLDFQELRQRHLGVGQFEYWLLPQAQIDQYRADILIWFQYADRGAGLVVECDGHDFHEKTKEQAAKDKKRDRDLLALGFPTMRFTGSEIYRDTVGCAGQVLSPLLALIDRLSGGRKGF